MKQLLFFLLVIPISGFAQGEPPAAPKRRALDDCPTWGGSSHSQSREKKMVLIPAEEKEENTHSRRKIRTTKDSYSDVATQETAQNGSDDFYTRKRYNIPVKREAEPVRPGGEKVNPLVILEKKQEKPKEEAPVPVVQKEPEPSIEETKKETATAPVPEAGPAKPEAETVKSSEPEPVPEIAAKDEKSELTAAKVGTKKVKHKKRFKLFNRNGVKKGRKQDKCPSF